MLAFLLLPVLTCGFFICYYSLPHFYKLHRYEGQQLYLKSAWLGVQCLFYAILVVATINAFVPAKLFYVPVDLYSFVLTLVKGIVPQDSSANDLTWLFLIAVTMHGIAFIRVWVTNWAMNQFQKKEGVDPKIKLMSEYYDSNEEINIPTSTEDIKYLKDYNITIEDFADTSSASIDSIYNRFNHPNKIWTINLFSIITNADESEYFYNLVANKVTEELKNSNKFKSNIATQIEPAKTFFLAEDAHQDYIEKTGRACHVTNPWK